MCCSHLLASSNVWKYDKLVLERILLFPVFRSPKLCVLYIKLGIFAHLALIREVFTWKLWHSCHFCKVCNIQFLLSLGHRGSCVIIFEVFSGWLSGKECLSGMLL